MRSTICGVGLLLAVSAAPGGDGKSRTVQLDGSWVVAKDGQKVHLTFDKHSFSLTFPDKLFKGTYKLDASKQPKHLDMTIREGEKYVGLTSKAIYAAEKRLRLSRVLAACAGVSEEVAYQLDHRDILWWCAMEPGADTRAADFPRVIGSDGKGQMYLIFKRDK